MADKHKALVAEILLLIKHVGDTSNLILDPDLDTYYLMDAFVNNLPEAAEHLGQLRALGALTPHRALSIQEKERFAHLSTLAKSAFEKHQRGMAVAFGINPDLKFALEGSLSRASADALDFLEFVDARAVQAESYSVPKAEHIDRSTAVINMAFVHCDAIAKALSRLIDVRVDKHQDTRRFVLVLSSIMAVLVLYVYIGFYPVGAADGGEPA